MTADNVLTVKIINHVIAARHGLHCTFMPKPICRVDGSGMHCNMSLGDKAGNNVFFDENGEITSCRPRPTTLLAVSSSISVA
ncbi:MAG: hypothetical protein R2857_00245 [Vampirovibrionales bacterium]